MKRVVLMIIPALICGVLLTSCNSSSELKDDEVITLSNGRTLHLENHRWLEKLIDSSKTDKTGNYWGCIWLEKFNGKDLFVTNMMLGSGGVMYYFFDGSGTCITPENPTEYANPLIEAFVGKLTVKQVDKEEFHTFVQNMKLDVLVYSSFSW